MSEKISLFKSRNTENTVNAIDIVFDNGRLYGYLLEPISIGADAKYSTFFNLDKQLGLVGEIASFAMGFNIGKAGMWTRQYYNGGSYLKITGKMRVVNWSADTTLATDAMRLMIANCMPTGSIKTLSKKIKDKVATFARGKKAEVDEQLKSNNKKEDDKTDYLKLKSQSQVLEDESLQNASSELNNIISNPGDTITNFLGNLATGQPSRARIKTNVLSLGNMVLKDVDITPSREMITSGEPLYADIIFSFEQGEIIEASEIRNKIGKRLPRVVVQ